MAEGPPVVWPLVGAGQMRALDRHTIETVHVPGELLMESAGRAVAQVVLELLPLSGEVCVVCGGGNNGGDGFVVARHLKQLGIPVRVALIGEAAALRGDAAANLARAKRLDVAIEGPEWRSPRRGVIVDALFGTGLARTIEGPALAAVGRIEAARSEEVRVVAVDLPSGLDADTGQVLGAAVSADVTVTIGLPKLALALEPGRSLAGRISVARIGIADPSPDLPEEAQTVAELWSPLAAGRRLPARPSAGRGPRRSGSG